MVTLRADLASNPAISLIQFWVYVERKRLGNTATDMFWLV